MRGKGRWRVFSEICLYAVPVQTAVRLVCKGRL